MAYNKEDNSELRALQLTELEIMRLFVKLCEQHRLRYYIVGGTMLGAMRHKGFIPWDDDMDVGMPRPDYERFREIAPLELPEGYAYLNFRDNPEHKRFFSRLVDKRVHVMNASASKLLQEEAWIDIFPLDGMPGNALRRKWHFWHMTLWRLLFHASVFEQTVNLMRPGRPWYQKLAIRFLAVTKLGQKADTVKIGGRIDKLLKKYPYDESPWVTLLFSSYLMKETVSKAVIGEGRFYPFEDMQLRGFAKAEEYLTQVYGDWRTPPKGEDKDKHIIQEIKYE